MVVSSDYLSYWLTDWLTGYYGYRQLEPIWPTMHVHPKHVHGV